MPGNDERYLSDDGTEFNPDLIPSPDINRETVLRALCPRAALTYPKDSAGTSDEERNVRF